MSRNLLHNQSRPARSVGLPLPGAFSQESLGGFDLFLTFRLGVIVVRAVNGPVAVFFGGAVKGADSDSAAGGQVSKHDEP